MLKGTISTAVQPHQPTYEIEKKLRLLPKEKRNQALAYARGLRDGYQLRSASLAVSGIAEKIK
jgi:hypothetical protein